VTDRATVVAGELPGALDRVTGAYDLVLLDPPYGLDPDVLAVVLARVADRCAPGAAVRLEQATRTGAPPWPDTLLPGRTRRYGDTTIHEAAPAPAAPDEDEAT
jgi:16S rRNA (guanine966-N2)-methyltransferase